MIDPIDIERTQCAGVGDVIMVTVGHSLVEWRDSIVQEVIAIAVIRQRRWAGTVEHVSRLVRARRGGYRAGNVSRAKHVTRVMEMRLIPDEIRFGVQSDGVGLHFTAKRWIERQTALGK